MTAKQVAEALRGRDLPLKVTVVFNETSDPAQLLGKHGGYLSKVAFSDSRVPGTKPSGTIAAGGAVEVYGNAFDARQRSEHIQNQLLSSGPRAREYHYLVGAVLLRISGSLTQRQAKDYEEALSKIGVPGP